MRPHAIHRNSLFCSGRIFVQKLTGWCCFQHEDLQNLSNSVQLIVTRIPISFTRHGISMEPLESRQLERSLGYPRMLEESSRSRLGIIVQEEVSCDRQAQDHDGRDKCSEPTCTTSFGCLQKMQNVQRTSANFSISSMNLI